MDIEAYSEPLAAVTAVAVFFCGTIAASHLAQRRKTQLTLRKRRHFLETRFDRETANRVLRGEVWEGATLEMMSEALGKPLLRNHQVGDSLTNATFQFSGAKNSRRVEVTFEKGRVVNWRELEGGDGVHRTW